MFIRRHGNHISEQQSIETYQVVGYVNGQAVRRAELANISGFQQSFKDQKMSQWCWAACISNCFTYHNHPIDQETIVKTVYGQTVNLPSMTARRIAEQLNRTWIDKQGQRFSSKLTGAYDYFENVRSLSNAYMIDQVKSGNPLIYVNKSHAMVVTAVDFLPDQVVGLYVFDPMPGMQKQRLLVGKDIAIGEIGGNMRFLATFTVS